MTSVAVDVALFGGGIAGLWTLARLRAAGYRAVLFEVAGLGGVQSIASQGIIHGGAKYALAGRVTGSSEAIRDMPAIWRACLDGHGEIDLGQVRVRSPHQLLWTQPGIAARLTGFLSSRIMQSRMLRLSRVDYPVPFTDPGFRAHLYRLDEPVLDTESLMAVLAERVAGACFRYDAATLDVPDRAHPGRFSVNGIGIDARRVVLTAGAGNAALLERWGRERPAMQLRPLQMVIARGALPALNGHWLGASRQLLLTVTSATDADGERVWYLGGGLSEDGVGREPATQIAAAERLLAEALPWLRLPPLRWQTLPIDRAEPRTADGSRPDTPCVDGGDGLYAAWPTKLAFAPRLAQQVLARLADEGIAPAAAGGRVELDLPAPELALAPWTSGAWS